MFFPFKGLFCRRVSALASGTKAAATWASDAPSVVGCSRNATSWRAEVAFRNLFWLWRPNFRRGQAPVQARRHIPLLLGFLMARVATILAQMS